MGLLEPSEGLIKIDGIALSEKNLSSWQAKIAHVPQAIYLSDASIASNIAFGISEDLIDYKKVKYAAQRAQISKTIESWVDGYATKVGERGVRLSGGQRQRIGLARAFYKNAQIIIFDEATSALDEDTEKSVMSSIIESGGNITMIIVAHRLSTLRNCDQVVKLKNGEIESVGTYAQIIGKTL
jgi:ATP-binding cassette subfamily B protein